MRRRGRLRRLALAGLIVPLVACQATGRVTVAVGPKGSGTVTVAIVLDKQAAERVPDLAHALAISDLQRAGWIADPVLTAPDGSVTASIHHGFGGPGQAAALLDQLGPVHLRVTHHHGLISSSSTVTGSVDLRAGADALGDAALAQSLGETLGAAVSSVKGSGGSVPDGSVTVAVQLAASPAHLAAGADVHGHVASWTVPLGDLRAIGATAGTTDWVAALWLMGAAIALVAALVLLAGGLWGRRSRHHHDHWSLEIPSRGR